MLTMTADIPLGHHSDGSVAMLNLPEAAPLFITHPDKNQWRALIATVGASLGNRSDIRWLICMDNKSMEAWTPLNNRPASLETFITDEPGSGTLNGRKQLVKAMMKAFRHRPTPKKAGRPAIYICIIEDIWDLIRKCERPDGQKLVSMLQDQRTSALKVIAGSSAGHRTLFPELLLPRVQPTRSRSAIQQPTDKPGCPGTELILGTEGLIFRSTPGGHHWEKWYAPSAWTSVSETSTHKTPHNGSTRSPAGETNQIQATAPETSLPENARMFTLDI